jgi:hypothetical protein
MNIHSLFYNSFIVLSRLYLKIEKLQKIDKPVFVNTDLLKLNDLLRSAEEY